MTIKEIMAERTEQARKGAKYVPLVYHYALHQKVLVVANSRIEGTWKAYCSDVTGYDHSTEKWSVLAHGDEIPEKIARVMFPQFEGIDYAR